MGTDLTRCSAGVPVVGPIGSRGHRLRDFQIGFGIRFASPLRA